MRPQVRAKPEVRFETGHGVEIQGDWTSCEAWRRRRRAARLGGACCDEVEQVIRLGQAGLLGLAHGTGAARAPTLADNTPLPVA